MELLKQLFEGAGLPADFETKAKTVFEAAIKEAVEAQVAEQTVALGEAMETKLAEAKEAFVKEQAEALTATIETTVVEWAKENAVALDGNIKASIAESFLEGLGNLYKEHSVRVVPDTAGVVESLQTQVDELSKKVDESTTQLADKVKLVEGYQRAEVLSGLTQGLAETQVERVSKLAEHFEFKDAESFKQKVSFVVEAVTGAPTKPAAAAAPAVKLDADGNPIVESAPPAAPAANPADTVVLENKDADPLITATLAFMAGK